MKKMLLCTKLFLFVLALFMTGCNNPVSDFPNEAVENQSTAAYLDTTNKDAQEVVDAPQDGLVFKLNPNATVEGPSRSVSYNSDLSSYISVNESSTGKYVITVNLRPAGKTPYRRAMFSVYNNTAPTGWVVNIGDSSTNNGYGGDSGTQQNDSELQVVGNTFSVYNSDKGGSGIISSATASNFLPMDSIKRVRYIIENCKVSYYKNYDTANTKVINSSNIFALNGQSDSEGSVNYTIYAAFNRTVNDASRSGSGVIDTIYVYLEDPIKTPAYEPAYWNNDSTIRSKNNCYNYGCNKRTDTFAQPGRGAGQMYSSINKQQIIDAAVRDGLEYYGMSMPTTIPEGKSLVAMIVGAGKDYHWYRKDRDTTYWSHKPGGTNAVNTDQAGKLITNPATCAWNTAYYNEFGGYFFVDSSYFQGQGTENIK